MKHVFTSISAIVLAGCLGGGAAAAMPRLVAGATTHVTAPAIEPVRLVCNHRRCYRTGYRTYYRPYGYYRPYYDRPRIGVGIGVGPFGVGVY